MLLAHTIYQISAAVVDALRSLTFTAVADAVFASRFEIRTKTAVEIIHGLKRPKNMEDMEDMEEIDLYPA